jgi:GAF domain-containing protein
MRTDSTRLQVLQQLLILDSQPEKAYDDIARHLANTLGVPVTMINLLDADRDWFKARVGLQQQESPAATSLCQVFLECSDDVLVVEDTQRDTRFQNNALVVDPPYVRFYAGARLAVAGQTVGVLCAYDMQPRQLSAEQLAELRTLTRAVMDLLSRRSASPR